MFNTTSNINNFRQNFNFNSVSGTLIKSNPLSKFVCFHQNSTMAEHAFSKEPYFYNKNVVILQIMLCGEKELLVEYIDKSDYDAQLKEDKGE